MYNEIIDLLEASSYPIILIHLIYDILCNEIDQVLYEMQSL